MATLAIICAVMLVALNRMIPTSIVTQTQFSSPVGSPSSVALATLGFDPMKTQSAASTALAQKQSLYLTQQAQPTPTRPTPVLGPTGIFDDPVSRARLKNDGFDVTNLWVEYRDGSIINIYAGAFQTDANQGGVVVIIRSPDGWFEKGFATPNKDGALKITDWQNERLVLVSANGKVFYFDIPALQYVASLKEIVSSATPLPTSTITPPLPTPDFSTPTLEAPATSIPTGYPIAPNPTSAPVQP